MIAPLPLLLSISRLTRTPFEATVNIHYYLTHLHDVAAFLTPHLPCYNVAPYIKLRVTIFASHLDSCINRVFSGVCCNPVIIITSAFSQRASDSTKLPPFYPFFSALLVEVILPPHLLFHHHNQHHLHPHHPHPEHPRCLFS